MNVWRACNERGLIFKEIEGWFYNCIFNEELGKYDIPTRHKHKVVRAWKINIGDCVHDGIGFEGDDGLLRTGCKLKDFSRV
jgi:hypothetical protein